MSDTKVIHDNIVRPSVHETEHLSLSLRARKKQLAQANIEEEALRLFLERGYEQTSIQDIADAVIMSPRTFFRYFASKEEVLLGPMRVAQREALHALQQTTPTTTLHTALTVFLTHLAHEYQEHRNGFLLRYQVIMQTPSITSLFLYTFIEAEPAICQALHDHLAAPADWNEIRFLVAIHMAALRVAIEEWLERDDNNNGTTDLVALLQPRLDQLASLSPE